MKTSSIVVVYSSIVDRHKYETKIVVNRGTKYEKKTIVDKGTKYEKKSQ